MTPERKKEIRDRLEQRNPELYVGIAEIYELLDALDEEEAAMVNARTAFQRIVVTAHSWDVKPKKPKKRRD